MYPSTTTDYILIAAGIWFVILTFWQFTTIRKFQKLTKGANSLRLDAILENITKRANASEQAIAQIGQEQKKGQKQNLQNFQKYALIRFNPFEDTGGDQSFVCALLNGKDNGIVISSLHTRGGTRVYAKPVSAGKAASHQFTKEEKEVVEKAIKS